VIQTLLLLVVAGVLASAVVRRTAGGDAGPAAGSLLRSLTVFAFALGVVSVGTSAMLLFAAAGSIAGRIALPLLFVLSILASISFLRERKARAATRPLAAPRPRTRGSRRVLVLVAIATLAAGALVVKRLLRHPDGEWDAVGIWSLRARLLHRAAGDASVAFAPEMPGSHPDYPLMLQGLIAAGWTLTGDGVVWVSGAIALMFGALTAAALGAGVAACRGTAVASLSVLAWLATPHVLREIAWRYADIPLSAFVVLSLGWLAAAYDGRSGVRSGVALAGTCASLAAWTKNEGIVPLLATGGVLLLRPPPGLPRVRALRTYALAALPFLAVLLAFKIGIAPENDLVSRTDAQGVLERLQDPSRYALIARSAFDEITRSSNWNSLFPIAIVASVLAAVVGAPRGGHALRAVGAAVLLVAGGYFTVYVLTPQRLAWHLETSLDRLLLQLWPSLLLLVALGVPGPEGAD